MKKQTRQLGGVSILCLAISCTLGARVPDEPRGLVGTPPARATPPEPPKTPPSHPAPVVAPKPATVAAPKPVKSRWRVAVVSDLNPSYGGTVYRSHVHEAVKWLTGTLRPDAVISTGDHVAGMNLKVDHDAMWRAFHSAVTEPLRDAHIPFAVTPGNHDASASAYFAPERERYAQEWVVRKPKVDFVDDTNYPFYYAYTVGPALFVSVDATVVGRLRGPQRAWLEALLERRREAVKIVYGHVPLYPFASSRERETLADPKLEALFKRTGVTAYLSGHHHVYYPGRRGDLRLVGMPCLGAGPRRLPGVSKRGPRGVVVLEFDDKELLEVEAHTGSGMRGRIERSSLPESIFSGATRVWRDDVDQNPPP